MHFRHRRKIIAAILLAVVAIFLYPTGRDHLRAASLLLRIQDAKTTSAIASFGTHDVHESVIDIHTPDGLLRARLYSPVGIERPPGMVIVHGIHHLGIEEPRLVAFARAFSQAGVMVLTPELKDVSDYRITPQSVTTIGNAAAELHRRVGHPVGILGLSFSGGLALMTAAEDLYKQDVAFVVSVGGHHDMARVARFLATGRTTRPDGSEVAMLPHEYGALVLVYSQVSRFFPAKDVPVATEALRLLLYEQPDAAKAKAAELSAPSRAKMELLFSKHREDLREELLADIAANELQMAAVSPRGKLNGIAVPVLLLHGTGDEVIPASESQWLASEIPPQHFRALLISPAITHVEVGGKPSLADKLRLVHFMAQMLRELSH
jgi:pimeloyl-ACP methyl ester carboxylesterase